MFWGLSFAAGSISFHFSVPKPKTETYRYYWDSADSTQSHRPLMNVCSLWLDRKYAPIPSKGHHQLNVPLVEGVGQQK